MPGARIEGLVALRANVAVVFRRGPSRETQMLLWDMNRDTVTPGQWVRARVNVRSCDVSPHGDLLVAGLYDADPRRESGGGHPYNASGWTAISRPPYFTALTLWFDHSGTGGFWSSGRDLHLADSLLRTEPDKGHLNSRIRRHDLRRPGLSDLSVFRARLLRDGWTSRTVTRHIHLTTDWRRDRAVVEELTSAGVDLASLDALHRREFPHEVQIGTASWERLFPGGRLVRTGTGGSEETLSIEDEAGESRWERSHPWNSWGWIDLDARGRIVYADEGCLWAWADFPDGEPSLIADLDENQFEAIAPPDWAREWPSSSPPDW